MSDISLGNGLFWLVIALIVGYIVVLIADIACIILYIKNSNPLLMFAIVPLSVIVVLAAKDFITLIGKLF